MSKSMMRAFGAVLLCGVIGLAQAEDPIPDKFRFAIGGFTTTRADSTLLVTDSDAGVGVSINPRDALGLEVDTTVLRIEGHYRLADVHALTYSWYNIQSDGNKSVETEFDWVDRDGNSITIPIGAELNSSLDTEIYKIGYLWSFYKSKKMEVAIGGGLHYTRLEIGLDSTLTNPPQSRVKQISSDLPLPVFSFAMNYKVTDKFSWFLKTEAFALAFDDYRGAYRDTLLGLEYRFWQHVALGAGLTTNSLQLDEDNDDYKLRYDNGITGGLLYVATYF